MMVDAGEQDVGQDILKHKKLANDQKDNKNLVRN